MAKQQNRGMILCETPIACGGCHMLKRMGEHYVCSASAQVDLLNVISDGRYTVVTDECKNGIRHRDCPIKPMKDTDDALARAYSVIKDLLTSRYGSPCMFCKYDKDKNAMCNHIDGSGSWCCDNAEWNGLVFEENMHY